MGIAMSTFAGLYAPFQKLMDWLAQPSTSTQAATRAAHAPWRPAAARTGAHAQAHGRADLRRPANRPLRVVRVMETRVSPLSGGGRMVISGRMADVCAELDRLVALEATRH